MKTLLVAEYREGKLQSSVNDLMAFAKKVSSDAAMFLVGSETDLPKFQGTLSLAVTSAFSHLSSCCIMVVLSMLCGLVSFLWIPVPSIWVVR